ncbi:collagen alpha-1(I) chain-like [Phyllostomus discolor]|uniref:Collagen alpha-1(I) chain-like n=1 Tax=Phyllostomus discolor TaxID=89673 RepID=A0A6J2N9L1_9CHIR|nr:collagen alpha-1(I) chain-like [Phyllostomus discolor]
MGMLGSSASALGPGGACCPRDEGRRVQTPEATAAQGQRDGRGTRARSRKPVPSGDRRTVGPVPTGPRRCPALEGRSHCSHFMTRGPGGCHQPHCHRRRDTGRSPEKGSDSPEASGLVPSRPGAGGQKGGVRREFRGATAPPPAKLTPCFSGPSPDRASRPERPLAPRLLPATTWGSREENQVWGEGFPRTIWDVSRAAARAVPLRAGFRSPAPTARSVPHWVYPAGSAGPRKCECPPLATLPASPTPAPRPWGRPQVARGTRLRSGPGAALACAPARLLLPGRPAALRPGLVESAEAGTAGAPLPLRTAGRCGSPAGSSRAPALRAPAEASGPQLRVPAATWPVPLVPPPLALAAHSPFLSAPSEPRPSLGLDPGRSPPCEGWGGPRAGAPGFPAHSADPALSASPAPRPPALPRPLQRCGNAPHAGLQPVSDPRAAAARSSPSQARAQKKLTRGFPGSSKSGGARATARSGCALASALGAGLTPETPLSPLPLFGGKRDLRAQSSREPAGSSTEDKARPPPAQLQDTRPLPSLTSRGGAGAGGLQSPWRPAFSGRTPGPSGDTVHSGALSPHAICGSTFHRFSGPGSTAIAFGTRDPGSHGRNAGGRTGGRRRLERCRTARPLAAARSPGPLESWMPRKDAPPQGDRPVCRRPEDSSAQASGPAPLQPPAPGARPASGQATQRNGTRGASAGSGLSLHSLDFRPRWALGALRPPPVRTGQPMGLGPGAHQEAEEPTPVAPPAAAGAGCVPAPLAAQAGLPEAVALPSLQPSGPLPVTGVPASALPPRS